MSESRSRKNFLALPLLLMPAAVSLAAVLSAGWLFIDDAYITFRYAENLAHGLGFVYNPGERVLGTTAPLYCLWLALGDWIGIPTLTLALITGIMGAAAGSYLLWRLGRLQGLGRAGYAAGLLLAFFPRFWISAVSGLETTLAAALALLSLSLDSRKWPALAGLALAALVLTRPDAASLAAAVLLTRLVLDRKAALIEFLVLALFLLPWLTFGWDYFGSPIPHSIAAKRLIHPFPWNLVLSKELRWFISEPGLVLLSGLWFAGAGWITARRRELLPLVLWPIFFLSGLAATQVGPFFWYRAPLIPAYLFVAGLGLESLAGLLPGPWAGRLRVTLVTLLLGLLLAPVPAALREGLPALVAKERVYQEMADRVRQLGRPGDKVLVGDVGVLGYRLQDYYILDSSGINSMEVYRIRLEDREKLLRKDPSYRFDWWGTPEWSRQVMETYRPAFIASDLSYLHLKELGTEPGFSQEYRLDQTWSVPPAQYGLLVRNPEPAPIK
jgi:arabinofuranosyltransferase